jgi:signal peptidase I
MFFLTPRHVKHGRQFIKDAEKLLAYKRDLVSPGVVAEVEAQIAGLKEAVHTRDEKRIDEEAQKLDQVCGKLTKPVADQAWRENVEVFLVAIVIALGVRTYFLQPFTIPTGSMQPTLNGIIFHKQTEPPPNILLRTVHGAVFGRDWVDIVAKQDEMVINVRTFKSLLPFVNRTPGINFGFFSRTELVTDQGNRYVIPQSEEVVQRNLELRQFKAGEPIIRGYFNTGDHVFVDKFTYNFRPPQRGEVFVFSTAGIPLLNRPGTPSQFYIKRLAGLPSDNLRIDPPRLFVNGEVAKEEPFQRVMSGTIQDPPNAYRGYGNGAARQGYDQQVYVDRMQHLGTPLSTYTVPDHSYVALGDNSYNSLDSRAWGSVPEKNVMGRGVLVYWPFTSHWGRIR